MTSKAKKFKKEIGKVFDHKLSVAEKASERIKRVLSGAKNIENLMTEKVDDFVLVEEEPLHINIGERTIFIGNLTYENEHTFFNEWAEIIATMAAKIINMEITSERRDELLKKGDFHLLANSEHMLEFLMMDRWLFDRMVTLIDKTILKQQAYYRRKGIRKQGRWRNCSKRYFAKHITKEKLIQICYLTYFYNFDAVKKNVQILINKMNLKSLAGTYMYFWLRKLDGLTGEFAKHQAPSIDYVFRDKPKTKPQEKQKRKTGSKGNT